MAVCVAVCVAVWLCVWRCAARNLVHVCEQSSGPGWLSTKLRGLFLPEDVKVAQIDDAPENDFYYNEELKRWVRKVR